MTGWGKAVADSHRTWAAGPLVPLDGAALNIHSAIRMIGNPGGRREAVLDAGWYLREWRHRQGVQRHRSEDLVGFTPEALLWVALRDAAGAECHRVRGGDLNVQVAFCRGAEAALRTWWRLTEGGAR